MRQTVVYSKLYWVGSILFVVTYLVPAQARDEVDDFETRRVFVAQGPRQQTVQAPRG